MQTEWNKIIGHEWAAQLLHGAVQQDRVGHAYLITGPAQIGKTTLAKTFAQALNCVAAQEAERPCGQCRPCRLIAAERHPDAQLVEPELSGRGKLTLKIDQIRELQSGLNLAAYEARRKVAILPRFDAATPGAANAFLKTLEEPPGSVVVLLTATDADTLLPTIPSRCRVIGLRPIATPLIEESLIEHWGVPADQAHLLAHLADGRLGWAVNAATDPTILQTRAQQLEHLQQALAGKRVKRFQVADKLARDAEALPALLQTWLSWWRDLTLLAQAQRSNGNGRPLSLSVSNIDQREDLTHRAERWPAHAIFASLKRTNLALWQLERNANTRLLLENLLLTYPLPE